MEDFTLNTSNESHASEELSLQVSAICERDGQKMAYVTFSDDTRHAEGEIPA
ncbi:MAG: hypothetical protein IIU40_09715 [Lachnospiraceae bacterium]|nr:hypothetical protein [Lachnospiraceae bacterium]